MVRDRGRPLEGSEPQRWTAILSFIGQVRAPANPSVPPALPSAGRVAPTPSALCPPAPRPPTQVFGCISAYPSARLSDFTGRKPMVALACGGIIAVYLLFCFISDLRMELVIGGLYGFFNGAFLSVDYALALDTVPSKDDAARWLAVWGVAGFVGTSAGPIISGPVLLLWPGPRQTETGVERNPLGAYRALLVIGALWMGLSAFFLTFIDLERAQLRGSGSGSGAGGLGGRGESDGEEGGSEGSGARGDSPDVRLHLVPGQGLARREAAGGGGGLASALSDNALVAHEGLADGVVVGGAAGTEGVAVLFGGLSKRHGSPLRHRGGGGAGPEPPQAGVGAAGGGAEREGEGEGGSGDEGPEQDGPGAGGGGGASVPLLPTTSSSRNNRGGRRRTRAPGRGGASQEEGSD